MGWYRGKCRGSAFSIIDVRRDSPQHRGRGPGEGVRFPFVFPKVIHSMKTVSYTHLTLPTNREV